MRFKHKISNIITLHIFIAFIAMNICSVGCIPQNEKDDYISIINQFVGNKIIIPSKYVYNIQETTFDYDMTESDYKVITFIDESDCTTCKLKLQEWDDIINNWKSSIDTSISFLMILNTSNNVSLLPYIIANNFCHPIVFDKNANNSKCHTFLLDDNNIILAIGDPVLNPQIRKLFNQIINKDFESSPNFNQEAADNSIFLCSMHSIPLGILTINNPKSFSFELKNRTNNTISIEEIITSCNCIKASVSTNNIYPNNTSTLNITLQPTIKTNTISQYIDIFYNGYSIPERFYLNGYMR